MHLQGQWVDIPMEFLQIWFLDVFQVGHSHSSPMLLIWLSLIYINVGIAFRL